MGFFVFPARVGLRGLMRHAGFRVALMTLGIVLAMALLADLWRGLRVVRKRMPAENVEPVDVLLHLDAPPYRDPEGWFSMALPRGWHQVAPSPGAPYRAVFEGPHGTDLSVRVDRSRGESFDAYVQALRSIERGLDARMRIETIAFGDRLAVKREFRLHRLKLFVVDFFEGAYVHQLQFAAPPEAYDTWLPVAWEIMLTYRPGAIEDPAEEPLDFLEPIDSNVEGLP